MKPMVSIVCLTFNHEKYIADAIESFLMQKVDFPIEIIIHDDASTDNTADIIRVYESRYPNLIKPIYQKENQHSKKVKIGSTFIFPLVRGKYVATCEGDDFWNNPEKLQKQVDFLESNANHVMCFHAVAVIDTNKNFLGRYWGFYGKGSREYTIKDTVKAGTVHVSSRLIRSKYYKQKRPGWMSNATHGDYAFALFLSTEGKVYYIDEVMSSYRTEVEGSKITNFKHSYTAEKEIQYLQNRIETLNMADKYYKYRYHNEIQMVNLISEVKILLLENKISIFALSKYWLFLKQEGVVQLIKYLIKYTTLSKMPKATRRLLKMDEKWKTIIHKIKNTEQA